MVQKSLKAPLRIIKMALWAPTYRAHMSATQKCNELLIRDINFASWLSSFSNKKETKTLHCVHKRHRIEQQTMY